MTSLSDFLQGMDWWGLLGLLISAAAALFCITVHELSHGLAACLLGDPTAKNAGRLSLNPIRHIDPMGLAMMLVAKVGWAKPVPVDMRYFKKPKQGMALTALAGPASNFVLAFLAVAVCSLAFRLPGAMADRLPVYILLDFLSNVAILSVGLGIFNLIPISPLDGSKILLSFLPDKVYLAILRYERYVMGLVLVLTFLGVFSRPLSWLMTRTLGAFCSLLGFQYGTEYLFLFSDLFHYFRF